MSILTQPLPVSVSIADRVYDIAADFRAVLRIHALRRQPLSLEESGWQALSIFYLGHIPQDIEAAVQKLIWFLHLGETTAEQTTSAHAVQTPPDFCFEQDAPLLYAAFLEQYHMDLLQIPFLHWWAFHALLEGLHGEVKLQEVRRCRTVNLSQIKDPQLKQYYRQMQKVYALQPDAAAAERRQKIEDILQHNGDLLFFFGKEK